MTDYSWALQVAIRSALITPAMTGVQSVRDTPDTTPSDSDFPFIVIGESQEVPDDTVKTSGAGDGGVSEFIDLHVWSRYRGQKEAKEIAAAIYDRLHGSSLSVTGRVSALCWVRSRRIFTDTDGLTRHGVISIEVIHRS